jgi:hypothetical protein
MSKKRVKEITDVDFVEVDKKEEKPTIDMSFNQQEAEFESVISPNDSPLNEPVKERIGGDDFLRQSSYSQVTPENPLGPNPFMQEGDAEELKFEDPEQLLMKQSEEKVEDLDKETINETSDMLSDVAINLFSMVAPVAAESYYKIPERKIKELEKQDKLPEGTIDHVKQINKEQRNSVTLDKSQKDLIRKPLSKVLEGKGVKTKPEWVLALCLVAVVVMLWIKARSIKKENDETVLNFIDAYAKAKEKARRDADKEEQMMKDQDIQTAVVVQ